MDVDAIRDWDTKARANYTYVTDGAVNTWRSWADKVLAGEPWTGDCDDLAHTVLDLCGRAGMSLANRYRLFVTDPYGAGHMVGAVQDDARAWWIVGDTERLEVYPAAEMKHTPYQYNRLSEAGPGSQPEWRAGVPWKANLP